LEDVQGSTGTTSFFESFRPLVERSGHCEIVICPSFLDVEAAVAAIVCVGEREKKNMESVLTEQFRCGIGELSEVQFARIVIAYEPVWAIGEARPPRRMSPPMLTG
jgi:triosephosphate isomerase